MMGRSHVTMCLAALPALVSLGSLGSFACSSSNKGGEKPTADGGPEASSVEAGADGGEGGEGGEAGASRPDDMTAATNRAACMYARGAMAGATLGSSMPVGDAIPIDNVVIVMMENHSFDNYFSHLNQYANRTDIESEPAGASSPDSMGNPQPAMHAQHECTLDTDHSWSATHLQIHGGKMDGFFTTNQGYDTSALPAGSTDPSLSSGARSLWWYDQTDLPYYYKLASTFAIADHYHAAVPGPTWPNRLYLYAATSFGKTFNLDFPDLSAFPYPGNPASILDELEAAKIPWMMYSDGAYTSIDIIYGIGSAKRRFGRTVTGAVKDFTDAAQAGKLPTVSFVDPDLTSEVSNGAGLDEHPPGDIQAGETFVANIVQAVTTGPQWAHTAMFLTWDEHGGFYDHFPPPPACKPDAIPPKLDTGDTTVGGFDMEGVRVAMMVISPYAKAAYVGHHTYDHASIARFVEAKFNLPALTARDANAEPPTDMFDFSTPAFATAPTLPQPTLDDAGLAYCTATFGM